MLHVRFSDAIAADLLTLDEQCDPSVHVVRYLPITDVHGRNSQ